MPCNRFRGEPMTQREAIEAIGGSTEYPDFILDPKLGERNIALAKARWDAAQERVIGGELLTVCGDLEIPMCNEPACEHAADLLCDWPMGRGKTCDIALCTTHARAIGEDRHLCPIHHPMWMKRAGVAYINPWPPATRGR